MRAAESFGVQLFGSKKSPQALVKKLQDPNELVRIEVVESLGAIGDRKVLSKLWKAMSDRSPLVRSYVAGAIGELGSKEDIRKLERNIKKERSPTAKLGYYQALYRLGKRDVFEKILSLLESRDYRLRCATANTLMACIVDASNSDIALSALRKALKAEPTIAAKSTFQACIRSIRKWSKKRSRV